MDTESKDNSGESAETIRKTKDKCVKCILKLYYKHREDIQIGYFSITYDIGENLVHWIIRHIENNYNYTIRAFSINVYNYNGDQDERKGGAYVQWNDQYNHYNNLLDRIILLYKNNIAKIITQIDPRYKPRIFGLYT